MANKFELDGWTYVDAGGNQIWREKELWHWNGIKLKHPIRDIDPLSIAEYREAVSRARSMSPAIPQAPK